MKTGSGGAGSGGAPSGARDSSGGTSSSSGGQTAQGGTQNTAGAAGGPTCGELTATNIEGPFFQESSPERTNIRGALPGHRLTLTGVVQGPDCKPIAGALVDFWQADEDGAYDNEGNTFRGHQLTDGAGQYTLETIIPGRYLNGAQFRPAHIHVKVSAGGQTLTTQLYFPADPFNDVDAFIDFSLLVAINEESADKTAASFDFVLPSA
jgi:protocatechuate 3,4-dioxygenase beta subunit